MSLTTPTAVTKLNPLTEITLYKLVDIDKSYANVHRFKNRDERDNYFRMSFNDPLDFTEVKPVRIGGRRIRLNMEMDKVLFYNYLSFKNLNYDENRTYYCFINKVDWVNINCCEIEFEIDVWATYYFDIVFQVAFVERSHYWCSTEEKIGDNIEPEDFDYEDYIFLSNQKFFTGCEPDTVVVWFNDDTDSTVFAHNYYAGLNFKTFSVDYILTPSLINSFIQEKGERVKFISQAPSQCFYSDNPQIGLHEAEETIAVDFNPTSLGNYTPKNKKLFTYPFYYFMIYASNGERRVYKFEFFEDDYKGNLIYLKIKSVGTPDGFTSVYPLHYKGGGFNDRIILGDYPLCPYSQNTYDLWLSNGGVISALNKTLFATAAGAVTKGTAGAVGGLATGILSGVSTAVEQMIKPPKINGSFQSSGDLIGNDYGFYFARVCLPENELARADEFFNRYGYADNSLRKIDPLICNFWNYWKTEGNAVSSIDYTAQGGGTPAWAIETMNKCFKNGITFWDVSKRFGNYYGDNRDNRSLSPVIPQSIDDTVNLPLNNKNEKGDELNG